jgi:hypothetical protein
MEHTKGKNSETTLETIILLSEPATLFLFGLGAVRLGSTLLTTGRSQQAVILRRRTGFLLAQE